MEPIMLVSLLAIGFALVFAVQTIRNGKRQVSEDKVMKGYFLLGLSGLMAKIAAADGRVTADETEMAQRFFSGMELSDAERALCIGNFVTARRDGLDARDHAKRFIAYANPQACAFLYDLLWRLAHADGRLDEGEDALLKKVATYLCLDEATYERFKKGEAPHYDRNALRSAGVPSALFSLAKGMAASAFALLLAIPSARADVWQDCLAYYSAHTATNVAAGYLDPASLIDIRHAADPEATTHGMVFSSVWKQSYNTITTRTESIVCPAAEKTIEDKVIYFAQPTYVNAEGKTVITNQGVDVSLSVNAFSNTVKGTALLRFRMDDEQPNTNLVYLLNMGYSWKNGGFAVRYVPKTNGVHFVWGNASPNNFTGLVTTNAANPSVTGCWTELAVIYEENAKTGRVRLGLGQTGSKAGMRWGEAKGSWLSGVKLNPFYSPRIGAYTAAAYASKENNQLSSFRGSVHFAAFWNRVLTDAEVEEAFATPRPKVLRMGGEGYGHEMFAGASGAECEAKVNEQHRMHGSFGVGESTTLSFDIPEGTAGKMQALRVVAATNSAAGTLSATLDGASAGTLRLAAGGEAILYLAGERMTEGSHKLSLMRTDEGAGLVTLDLVEIGGSWRHGKADGKMGEFAGDGGRIDIALNRGYTGSAHSKISTDYSWQRLAIVDDIPASLAAACRYRMTIAPCWISPNGAAIKLTLNDCDYRSLDFGTDLSPKTIDFPAGTLKAGENTFKLTAERNGLSLDYVDLSARGPFKGLVIMCK